MQPVGTHGCEAIYFGMGGVGGEWIGGWDQGLEVGPNSQLAQKVVNRAPIAGGGRFRHKLQSSLPKLL